MQSFIIYVHVYYNYQLLLRPKNILCFIGIDRVAEVNLSCKAVNMDNECTVTWDVSFFCVVPEGSEFCSPLCLEFQLF